MVAGLLALLSYHMSSLFSLLPCYLCIIAQHGQNKSGANALRRGLSPENKKCRKIKARASASQRSGRPLCRRRSKAIPRYCSILFAFLNRSAWSILRLTKNAPRIFSLPPLLPKAHEALQQAGQTHGLGGHGGQLGHQSAVQQHAHLANFLPRRKGRA